MRFPYHSRRAFVPWAVRQAFHVPSSTMRVYMISSLVWPGAHAYAKCVDNVTGAKYCNVYIGNGIKRDRVCTPFL